MTAAFVSFVSRLLEVTWARNCFFADSLSAVVWLLPGLSITLAVVEMGQRHMLSGSSRFFTALIDCVMLGFGIQMGAALVFWEPNTAPVKAHCPAVPTEAQICLFPVIAISFAGAIAGEGGRRERRARRSCQ